VLFYLCKVLLLQMQNIADSICRVDNNNFVKSGKDYDLHASLDK